MLSSKPLIRFNGTKLILVENELPTTPVRILSIIGKARMGKSSFLNAFISKYNGKNTTVFTTQDGDDHCTLGIDYYYLPEHNLLLLDSQGLAHENSSHDPSLLLFIYLVSNIIIFNESTMLQNSALRLIEPICTFTQYLDMDACDKPSLMFRISDAKKGSDINKTLEKLMAHHDDQYNSIRESIENVFAQPVKIIKTEYPQVKDDEYLSTNDYLSVISSPENGFDTAIGSITANISSVNLRENILSKLSEYVDSINNNEQININKLDIVSLTHNNDLLTWLAKVPGDLKSEIEVDGTQETYEKNVVIRQANVKKLKTEFTKRFKAISETIKKEHKAKLDAELDGPIQRAKDKSEEMALKSLKGVGLDALMLPRQYKVIEDAGLTTDYVSLQERIFADYQKLQKYLVKLYEPIRVLYDTILNAMYAEAIKKVENARNMSEKQRSKVQIMCNSTLENFDSWLVEEIQKLDETILLQSNSELYKKFRDRKIDEVTLFIHYTVTRLNVNLSIKSGNKLEASIEGSLVQDVRYKLIADIYTDFVENINKHPIDDGIVHNFLVDMKEEHLRNKLLLDPVLAKKIRLLNPEIKFVYDSVLLKTCVLDSHNLEKTEMPYMTLRTWKEVYEPMYGKVVENLLNNGLCKSTNTFRDFIVEVTDENIVNVSILDVKYPSQCTMYQKNICNAMIPGLKKVYCEMIVNDVKFPDELTFTL
jgi:hypothetical protein